MEPMLFRTLPNTFVEAELPLWLCKEFEIVLEVL